MSVFKLTEQRDDNAAPPSLAKRIAEGDTAAEAELIERYRPELIRLLLRWTRDTSTAEDLCQETFRVAIEKMRRGELRRPDGLQAFLWSLGRNLSIQFYRRHDNRRDRFTGSEALPFIIDPGPEPLSRMLQDERLALVRRVVLHRLSDRDREVLVRFYLLELGVHRICTEMDLSYDQFYRVLHRARQRCRRLLLEAVQEFDSTEMASSCRPRRRQG